MKDEFISLLDLPDVHIPKFMSRPTYIAFHIRRGDYLKYPDIHHICDTEYFKYFFDFFGPPILKDTRILVFTDSIDHVKQEFSDHIFDIVDETELKEFSCMSKCDLIVGSNSTFSWWASLIAGKPCYFPSKWFADGREHQDIFRKDMKLHDV